MRKGEKGAPIVKWGTYQPDKTKDSPDEGEDTKTVGYLRFYSVFNATQIEGIEFPQAEETALSEKARIERADQIVSAMPNAPLIGEGRHTSAYYDRVEDTVHVPDRRRFDAIERFYETLFHELVHATGHAKRLARKTLMEFRQTGDRPYCREELVAEMGASFLLREAGIEISYEASASYIASWLKVLRAKGNRRWIIQAAGQACKAADYIRDRVGENGEHAAAFSIEPATMST